MEHPRCSEGQQSAAFRLNNLLGRTIESELCCFEHLTLLPRVSVGCLNVSRDLRS
jgi:hypothetical protein